MGTSRWSPDDWAAYSTTTATKSRDDIFTSTGVPDDLNPAKFGIRESRDSALNPESNAIIIATDVTGSMGMLAETLARTGIGTTFTEILARAAQKNGTMITDPQLLVMGIGDVACDTGPVQATQFETDIKIAEQLERIWIEGGGGGNDHESYDAPWYFAAQRTSIDCFEKRGRKGYLFTVGDEETPTGIPKAAIKRFFGDDSQVDFTSAQLLTMAERTYHVFHIIVEEGSHARGHLPKVTSKWKELLGQRVLSLSDHTKLAETIVSAIQVTEGMNPDDAAASWSGATSLVVANAIRGLSKGDDAPANAGVVRL